MKVYVVSQGNEEFYRVYHVDSDWNRAVKYAVEELEAPEVELRDSKTELEGRVVWNCWGEGLNIRITQLDLS